MIARVFAGAVVAAIVFASTTATSEATGRSEASLVPHQALEVSPASEARLNRDLAYLVAPIKSRRDLEAYLAHAGRDSPLNALSESARARFVGSVTFSKKGVSGFDYSDLVAELSAKQAYRILALFGEQHITAMIKNLRVEDSLDEEIMAQGTPMAAPKCVTYPINCPGGDPIGTDYEDMKCESAGTCAYAKTKICTQNC